MRIAIIDLGTNTCNLLVAEAMNNNYKILHQSKQLVKLGDNKIKANEISHEATYRVLEAFSIFNKIIADFKTDKVKVIATSAIRTALNKKDFLETIEIETGLVVNVISGEREAELIFRGVLLAFGDLKNPAVVLDIGGGSNELIIVTRKEMIWKESRPTGMARIINQFEISDPVTSNEIQMLKNYFTNEHKAAFEMCKKQTVKTMIGCSGAFDTIADIIEKMDPGEKQRTTCKISMVDFYSTFEMLIRSTKEERLIMKGMDLVRVDLIVPAVILIEHLISETGIQEIIQTDYALREGVLFEMMNNPV